MAEVPTPYFGGRGFALLADWSRRVSRRSRRTACSRVQCSTGRPSTRSKNAAACRAKREPGRLGEVLQHAPFGAWWTVRGFGASEDAFLHTGAGEARPRRRCTGGCRPALPG